MADNVYTTEYRMDAANYEAGAAAVIGANAAIEGSMALTSANTTTLIGGLAAMTAAFYAMVGAAGVVYGAMQNVGGALAGVGTAIIGLRALDMAKPFIELAMEVDNSERRFGALLGTMEKGKLMMDWVRRYSIPSVLDAAALTGLATVLIQSGQDVARMMPVMESLALGGGGDPTQNGIELASIMRRLAGGQTADALGPEGLGRFGINRRMLEAAGAQFDTGGRFMGSPADAFAMLETLTKTNQQFRLMREMFDDSPAVRWSTAMDSVRMVSQEVGGVLANFFLPSLTKAGEYMRYLVDSGTVKRLFEGLGNMLGFSDGKGPDLFLKAIVGVVTALEMIPLVVDRIRFSFQFTAEIILNTVNMFLEAIRYIPLIGPAAEMGIKALSTSIKTIFNAGTGIGETITEGFGERFQKNLAEASAATGNTTLGFGGNIDLRMAMNGAPPSGGVGLASSDPYEKHLAGIEANTKKLTLQFNDAIYGGSGLGLDSAEMAGVTGKHGGGSRREKARAHLERALSEIAAMNMEKVGRALAR